MSCPDAWQMHGKCHALMHGRCTAKVHGKHAWQQCMAKVHGRCIADDAWQMHGRCHPLMHGRCLQAWQMAPFVEAVLRQQRSQPIIRAMAKLLQARHERTRTRTLERSLMHLQQLAEAPSQPLPPIMIRLRSPPTFPCCLCCACVCLCTLCCAEQLVLNSLWCST